MLQGRSGSIPNDAAPVGLPDCCRYWLHTDGVGFCTQDIRQMPDPKWVMSMAPAFDGRYVCSYFGCAGRRPDIAVDVLHYRAAQARSCHQRLMLIQEKVQAP